MRKTPFLIVLAAMASVVLLPSCGGNSGKNGEMQQPAAQLTDTAAMYNTEENEDEESEGKSSSVANTKDASTLDFENLQAAFKGETTASAKYAAYSKKAEEEGMHEIAILFKAASASEKIHANNHRAVLEEGGQQVPVIKPEFSVKSTKENLQDAITGEGYEISTMYPQFITNANTAGNQLSLLSLNYAYKTEKKHKVLYEKALAAIDANTVKTLPTVYYLCPTCGNTYETNSPKRCGISMTSSDKFIKISNV